MARGRGETVDLHKSYRRQVVLGLLGIRCPLIPPMAGHVKCMARAFESAVPMPGYPMRLEHFIIGTGTSVFQRNHSADLILFL